jgi:hypothetical protein
MFGIFTWVPVNENKPVAGCPVLTLGPLLDVGPFAAPKLNTGADLAWSGAAEPMNENIAAGLL